MKLKLLFPSVFLFALCGALVLPGCASRKPKSSSRIIMEGDPNPQITYAPERAGESARKSGPRH